MPEKEYSSPEPMMKRPQQSGEEQAPPVRPDLPIVPPGGGPSQPPGSSPSSDPGLSISSLVAKLITDMQTGIQAAFLQQVESTRKEMEMLRTLPEERLAGYLVSEEEAIAEFRRLFLATERAESQLRTSAAVLYKPASPERGEEEDPPIKRLTGYEIKPEDVREGYITPEGERRIIEHLRMRIARDRVEAAGEVYRRGVPYLLVDHGKISVKLAFYVSPQQPRQTQQREPGSSSSTKLSPVAPAEAIPLEIKVRVVNEKNVEALGREAGAIGEIEISFKVDLR